MKGHFELKEMSSNPQYIPGDFAEVINDNFWEIIDVVKPAGGQMLTDREKEIIDLYFGINKRGENQARPLCLEEIAHKFDLTRERIRQLKERALKKMVKINIDKFVADVEEMAEAKMLKTGKLEGAHYAAMKELQKQGA